MDFHQPPRATVAAVLFFATEQPPASDIGQPIFAQPVLAGIRLVAGWEKRR